MKEELRKLIKDAERLEETLTELQKAATAGSVDGDWTLYMAVR